MGNVLLFHGNNGYEGKIKGEMKVTRRRWWRPRKLLDDLKDRRGYSHLKEEALDRTMWRRLWTCRKTEYWMNEWLGERASMLSYTYFDCVVDSPLMFMWLLVIMFASPSCICLFQYYLRPLVPKIRKGKAVPLQACSGPEGSRTLRFPDFKTTAQDGW